jgi:hypothetical protein
LYGSSYVGSGFLHARNPASAWLATKFFHIHSLQGLFNLSTWITAIAGSVVLLGIAELVDGQRRGRGSLRGGRRSVRAGRR